MIYKIDRIHGSLKRHKHSLETEKKRKDMEGKMMVGGHLYKLFNAEISVLQQN